MKLEISLTAKQSLFDQAVTKYERVFYGGAKGGGKSHGLRSIMLKRRLSYPGSTGYIFRRTYPELFRNHIEPLFNKYPELDKFYDQGKKLLTLPNSSKLYFASVEHERDLRKFQGIECHDLGIEEADQWPFHFYDYLQSTVRSAVVGIPSRTLLTGNPGGVGHKWLKRLFIDKNYEKGENPAWFHFIQALVDDNPAIMEADPGYVERLEGMRNELLRRAFRHGDWDIAAGQFFDEFRRGIHVVEPFNIPDYWQVFNSYDHGFNHPLSLGWYAVDPDGSVFKYRELVVSKWNLDQTAKHFHSFEDSKKSKYIMAGRDCWAKRGTGPSIQEEFGKMKMYFTQANDDRINGANLCRAYLKPFQNEQKLTDARFKVFSTCPVTIDCFSRMTHNPNNVEDVLKVDASDGDPYSGDDSYDETRYGLMSRPIAATTPVKKTRDGYADDRPRRSNWVTV